jgi:hypothetical protein
LHTKLIYESSLTDVDCVNASIYVDPYGRERKRREGGWCEEHGEIVNMWCLK